MTTHWTYDKDVDCAYIIIREEEQEEKPDYHPVTTLDLNGIHVMLDVDDEGNVLGIELLGHGGLVKSLHLNVHLNEDPNESDSHLEG